MSDTAFVGLDGKIPSRTISRKTLRLTLLGGLAGLAIIAGAKFGHDWWEVGRFVETTDDAYVGGDVTPISPHVAGFVGEILVQDNDYVHAGQVMIRLDDRDFRAALDHTQALLDQRQAALATLQAEQQSQQALIRQAQAGVETKRAEAAFAQDDDARYHELALSGAGSRQNAQRAESQNRAAGAAVVSAEAGVDATKQQLATIDAKLVEAKAAIAQEQADLATATLNLGYTEIRAPIDGYVSNRAAQVGAYVSGGAYLLTVVPAHSLWVDANFKEDQLARMVPGEAVTVVADILPDHAFRGHVVSLARGTGAVFSVIPPENATGNFTKIVQRVPVRVEFDAGDPLTQMLRPGLSVTASVDTRTDREEAGQ